MSESNEWNEYIQRSMRFHCETHYFMHYLQKWLQFYFILSSFYVHGNHFIKQPEFFILVTKIPLSSLSLKFNAILMYFQWRKYSFPHINEYNSHWSSEYEKIHQYSVEIRHQIATFRNEIAQKIIRWFFRNFLRLNVWIICLV